ncbi:MAG: HlyD family efflux transporter periplasmic adaptor subunit [Pseudomonadota bacterium]
MQHGFLRAVLAGSISLYLGSTALAESIVVVQSPFLSPVTTPYETNATLRSVHRIEYRAESPGTVHKILPPGQTFTPDSAIVVQVNPLTEVELQRSESVARELEADRDIAQLDVDDLDALLRANTVSEREANARRLRLKRAEARLETQRLEVKRLRQSVNDLTTYSARAGTIVEQQSNVGEFVGLGEPLVTAVDMSAVQYWITVPLSEAQLLNDESYITEIETGRNHTIEAIVPAGATTITIMTRAFDASNRPLGHLANSTVSIHFNRTDALIWFHRDAIIRGPSGYGIHVVGADNKTTKRSIEIKQRLGSFVGISAGIADGERVVLRGMEALNAGDTVRVAEDRTESLALDFQRLSRSSTASTD